MHDLTGLVLAGGGSRRMGRDKALLRLDDRPLVVRVAERIAPCCTRVVVASGDGRRYAALALDEVADVPVGRGPLAGIVAGLEAADTPLVAVVGVDMPDASPDVLARLADVWRGEAAVVPLVDDRVEPLHGVYATAAASTFRRLLAEGKRGVTHVLSTVGARVVGPEGWADLDPDGRFARDLDTPDDLAALDTPPPTPSV